MGNSIGEKICYYRQLKKMTQEEFASRIGVTPQAVSKWERDNGLPDIMVLSGIASVLGVSADTLLVRDEAIVENGDILAAADIKRPGKEDKIQELVIPFDYVRADWLPRAVQDTAEIINNIR